MNDETTAHLTDDWRIPAYAQPHLWVDSDSSSARAEGARGLFTLEVPAQVITVRWQQADGPALVQCAWQPDCLDWSGDVRVGGLIQSLHTTVLEDIGLAMTILSLEGQPLKPAIMPYASADTRGQPLEQVAPPDFFRGIDGDIDLTLTTWLLPEDSPLAALAESALLNQANVHLYGRLPDDSEGWHRFFALPLILEAVTIFAR